MAEAGMRLKGLGHAAFAVAMGGLGAVSLATGGFAYLCQPAPAWALGHPSLAYATGALLLACALGLLWPRTLARSALVLIACGLASMLLLHAPRLAAAPLKEVEWFNLGEIAALVAGAWILLASTARGPGGGVRIARLLFALSLLCFGPSHFAYAKTTAAMVPAFLPGHLAWTYLTGAAHIAAGLAILFGVVPRLAATLEALMVSTFVLAVNLPDLIKSGGHVQWPWTELFVAAAIAGAACLVASSYRRDRASLRPRR